jgi:hypothetical protein
MHLVLSIAALLVVACRGTPASGDERRRDATVPEAPRDAGDGVLRKAVPCVPKAADVSLGLGPEADRSVGGHAAICWDGRCIELALGEDDATVISPPGRPTAWIDPAVIRDHQGAKAACAGDACTPLGPQLAGALGTRTDVAVTTDRKVVVAGLEAWSVAGDRKLALKPPVRMFGARPAKVARLAVAGTWLIVTWASTECRDPANWADPACGLNSQLVDSAGANRGTELAYFSGGVVGQFDQSLFFTANQTVPDVTLFDIQTGVRVSELAHGVGFKILDALRVRPGLLAMLMRDGFVGYRLVNFIAARDRPIEITTDRYLPFCAR